MIGDILWPLTWPPAVAFAVWPVLYRFIHHRRWRPRREGWLTSWLSACAGVAIGALAGQAAGADSGMWIQAVIAAASAIAAILAWWWHRRKRRKVAALIGAKSRAIRDALVKRAREAAKPRQVLRLRRQGAS